VFLTPAHNLIVARYAPLPVRYALVAGTAVVFFEANEWSPAALGLCVPAASGTMADAAATTGIADTNGGVSDAMSSKSEAAS